MFKLALTCVILSQGPFLRDNLSVLMRSKRPVKDVLNKIMLIVSILRSFSVDIFLTVQLNVKQFCSNAQLIITLTLSL